MGSSYGSNSSSEDEDLILPAVEEIHKGNSELNTGIAKILATEKSRNRLLSLKELCCRFVGQNFPFGVVQLYPSRVPEDVQRRIAFWSFPTDVKKLLDYAKVMGGPTKYEVHFAIKSTVESMMQTGMYLTGTVLHHCIDCHRSSPGEGEEENFRACVQFDRGCITATKCSCGEQNWCRHVLALCLARLDESAPLQLHPPISETLTNLDRDQLQKLVQYSLEKLPLEGVAAVQEIASSLLDKGSEINQIPGAPDLTAGGCAGEKPVWQMDKNVILRRLNKAYEGNLAGRLHSFCDSTDCLQSLQSHKAALVGFKEFVPFLRLNASSEFYTLLLYEDDNLSIILKWALEKLTEETSSTVFSILLWMREITEYLNWERQCFCRMLLPVMQMFFVSPAISSSAKEDVTECLAQCLQQDLPSPIVELLNCFKEIATCTVLADTSGCRQLLSWLQQAISQKGNNIGDLGSTGPSFLHCAMAVVQYMRFYNRGCAAEMEDILATVCALLFPASLDDAASLEELVAIRAGCDLERINLPLLLEYGIVLLQCTSNPDTAAELIFRLLGSQLPLHTSSTDILVYRNYAENVMIAKVDEAETFTKACPNMKSKLAGLSIKWLQQTSHALDGDPNPIAALTGMWSMMRLVCRCGIDCLKVVSQMTQELIGWLSLILPINAPSPDAVDDGKLPRDIMADSFAGVLVDLFAFLQVDGCQEVFTTLHKVYPIPVDAKRSLELRYYECEEFHHLLNGAYMLTRHPSSAFFPKEPPMEGFEQQLTEVSNPHGYDIIVHPLLTARPKMQLLSDGERAEIVQVCRTLCSVSNSHVTFLEQLCKRLQEAGAPFQFQLQLLVAQVSNCVSYDWACRDSGRFLSLCDSLLASSDVGLCLQALKDMWKYAVPPECVVNLLETVGDQTSPQHSDIICDILLSVLDCKVSLHARIFAVLLDIGSKMGPILQAVNIASCGNNQSELKTTFLLECVEALGKSYNRHKASGAAEETLLQCREKAVELLQHARSIPVASSRSHVCDLELNSLDVHAVKQIVCDSGQQALADLLALMVKLTVNDGIYQSLKAMDELCDYHYKDYKDTPSDPSRLLKLSPFKEAVASLLQEWKTDIKRSVICFREISPVIRRLSDLHATYQFLGDEASCNDFAQELAAIVQNADRLTGRQLPQKRKWNMD